MLKDRRPRNIGTVLENARKALQRDGPHDAHPLPNDLDRAEIVTDDGAVMELSGQTLAEFAVLTVAGIVMSAVAALLVTDYRGFLASYTHRCWLFYQRPWYRRAFLWTPSSRAFCADEDQLRRTFRVVAFSGLAMGVFILSVELIAVVTGHVT
jgi:hypothetical protein